MKKYLLRISFIASLVCGFLLGSTVKAQGAVAERQHDKQQVKKYDGFADHSHRLQQRFEVGDWTENGRTADVKLPGYRKNGSQDSLSDRP